MSGIRGKDTKPELLIRSALHRAGFRYRLHAKNCLGSPIWSFPGTTLCCSSMGASGTVTAPTVTFFRWPQSREEFWREKIHRNVERDNAQIQSLLEAGYRVGIIWECAVKGRQRLPLDVVVGLCSDWLKASESRLDIHGHQTRSSV